MSSANDFQNFTPLHHGGVAREERTFGRIQDHPLEDRVSQAAPRSLGLVWRKFPQLRESGPTNGFSTDGAADCLVEALAVSANGLNRGCHRARPHKSPIGSGRLQDALYKVARPDDPVLLRGNRICGGLKAEPIKYIVVLTGNSQRDPDRHVAAFSTEEVPLDMSKTCATFSYSLAR